jgi:hypothetical protein
LAGPGLLVAWREGKAMKGSFRKWWQGVLVVAALAVPGESRCLAQFSQAGGFADPFNTMGLSGMAARMPSQGDWGEILTVTSKWMVIQNQQGQQFPISLAGVRLFVIRWPTTLDKIAPGALVEATGVDLGTNQVQTDHVDVFEGTANQLGVFPAVQTILGFNRIVTQFDLDSWNTYGYDLYRYLSPDEMNMPRRLHVVGPIVDISPLRLGVGGGIAITVVPTLGSFFMTSVTPGSTSLVRRGDLVYFVPIEATPKSLTLNQLVVYKKIALSQFVP